MPSSSADQTGWSGSSSARRNAPRISASCDSFTARASGRGGRGGAARKVGRPRIDEARRAVAPRERPMGLIPSAARSGREGRPDPLNARWCAVRGQREPSVRSAARPVRRQDAGTAIRQRLRSVTRRDPGSRNVVRTVRTRRRRAAPPRLRARRARAPARCFDPCSGTSTSVGRAERVELVVPSCRHRGCRPPRAHRLDLATGERRSSRRPRPGQRGRGGGGARSGHRSAGTGAQAHRQGRRGQPVGAAVRRRCARLPRRRPRPGGRHLAGCVRRRLRRRARRGQQR
jgi:hypothetical protein